MAKKINKIRILKQSEILGRVVSEMSPGEMVWVPFKLRSAKSLTSEKMRLLNKGFEVTIDTTDPTYGVITLISIIGTDRPEVAPSGIMGNAPGEVPFSGKEAQNV